MYIPNILISKATLNPQQQAKLRISREKKAIYLSVHVAVHYTHVLRPQLVHDAHILRPQLTYSIDTSLTKVRVVWSLWCSVTSRPVNHGGD